MFDCDSSCLGWTSVSAFFFFYFMNLNIYFSPFLCPSLAAAFMKQRRMGLNDFIQRLATNSYACKQ